MFRTGLSQGLYKQAANPIIVSDQLKAIFACENRLMKAIPKHDDKQYNWLRERTIHHIEQLNKITFELDSWLHKQRLLNSNLAQMQLTELASDEKQQIFTVLNELPTRSHAIADELRDLIDDYLLSLRIKIYIRLCDIDQRTVMQSMHTDDDDLELFNYMQYLSDDFEEELNTEGLPATPVPSPRLFQPKPEPSSVKHIARQYEEQRNTENQHTAKRLQ